MSRNGGGDGGSLLQVRIAGGAAYADTAGGPARGGPAPLSPMETACRFCPPDQAPRGAPPVLVGSPASLVSVATDARRSGVGRLRLTTEAQIDVADYVRAVRDGVPGMRVAMDCRPAEAYVLSSLAAAGVTDVGIHIGSLDDDVRARGSGGAAVLPLSRYERAWDEAVRVFGRYRVTTCLVVGAGENPGDLVAGAARLIARGVAPIVVPYQASTDALVPWIGHAVSDMLRTVGAAGPPH